MPARRRASTPRAPGSRPKCAPPTASCIARGHAHSVEVRLDGALVGGLYGVLARDGCSSANRCSAASAMPRKWRSPAWWSEPLWRDSNSSTASYLHLICAPWAASRCPVAEFSALVAPIHRRARRAAVLGAPENCFAKALFWQNSPPSRVPQVTDVERRCDSDGRRSRRDFA